MSEPFTLDLSLRGTIQGLTLLIPTTKAPRCHYFGGIPYAHPPTGPNRWRPPRPLAPCYRYGSTSQPGIFTGGTGVCPQPGYVDSKDDGSTWDEDCLQVNVWLPVGEALKGGWPVMVYIHGGFLQFGSANNNDPSAMVEECQCIVVKMGYRLNAFGFLASRDFGISGSACGNFGFLDQRLALEWTYKNISYFGGNASNITLAGYSAGAYSAFYQLAYDLRQPDDKAIVKRVIMWSNGPGVQPKTVEEAREQYDELLRVLQLPESSSAEERAKRLRSADAREILRASEKMKNHQFRPVTDGLFVRHNFFEEVQNGTLARKMKRRNIKLLIGECENEHWLYGKWRSPKNSLMSLEKRLHADYPPAVVGALLQHYFPDGKLPSRWKDCQEAFGRVYADMQVHRLQRGFLATFAKQGANNLVHRYRIEWRAKCIDKFFPPSLEAGVTHTTDLKSVWFMGEGEELEEEEKVIVRTAFLSLLADYLRGEMVDWGTNGVGEMRRLKADGTVDIWKDEYWESGPELWARVHGARDAESKAGPKL